MKASKIQLKNGFAPYPEYKDSGIEWIGKIPKEWDISPMRSLFANKKELIGSKAENNKLLSLTLHGVIRRPAGDKGKHPENYETYQSFKRDDLVMCLFDYDVTPRTIGHVPEDGMLTGAYTRLIPKGKIYSRYYYYLYLALDQTKELLHLCTGLRSSISKPVFWSMKHPHPSIETQKKIAEYLDEKTELIDRIIERKKRLIELLREKRTAVINQAVTKGLDPNVELVDSGIEWIGKIPKGWEVKKLKHFVKTTTSGVWGENQLNNVDDVRCLRIADFDYDNLSYSEVDTVRNIDGLKKEKILKKGDILVEKSGGGEKTPVGRAILFNSTEKMVCANFIDIVRVDASEMIPEYFAILLSALYAKRINVKYIKQNTGIQNLDLKAYFSEYIGFPGLDIQHKIVEYSHLKIMQSFELQSKVEKSIKTLKEFKASLISNVVTGKVRV